MAKPRPIEFLVTAGLLGGGSVVLAIILFIVAVTEHFRDHNVAASIFAGLTVVFFCLGAYWAWDRERDKYEAEVTRHGTPQFLSGLRPVASVFQSAK
jgi:high-affinity Fe2+/Pb2+ permease